MLFILCDFLPWDGKPSGMEQIAVQLQRAVVYSYYLHVNF